MDWIGMSMVGGLFGLGLAFFLYYSRRNSELSSWPTATAVVETANKERVVSRSYFFYRCLLGYSFVVEGSYFGGEFELRTASDDMADGIIAAVRGRKLQVRYNPIDPRQSFPFDARIDGLPVRTSITTEGKPKILS